MTVTEFWIISWFS